jgi:hypothetical protein
MPATRAVHHLLLGGIPGRSWSAEDAARHANFSLPAVESALADLEAVGVAERVDQAAGPPRYRWRQCVDYLEDGLGSCGFVDPVCEMPVTADSPYLDRDEGRPGGSRRDDDRPDAAVTPL